jgi:hypothetical protein
MSSDSTLAQNLTESIRLLEQHYGCKAVSCALYDVDAAKLRIVYPSVVPSYGDALLSYVNPYVNLRSTLFLPMSDAPWSPAGEGMVDKTTALDVGTTLKPASLVPVPTSVTATAIANLLQTEDTDLNLREASLGMNALVPVRYGDKSLGVIFVESIDFGGGIATKARQELDQFGVHLGLIVQRKARFGEYLPDGLYVQKPTAVYEPGTYHLEDVPWMSLWTHGLLRKSRETTWYLGLNLNSQEFLLAYCRLNGAKVIRDQLGSQLWHQLMTLRALSLSAGRSSISPIEIREELLRILKERPDHSKLDAVSLSFTVFNLEKREAASGHFGPSRPLVLGVENVVTPHNEAAFNLANGRALRYWEVKAALKGSHAYILPHDSSHLDALPARSLASIVVERNEPVRVANFQRLLQSIIPGENVLRYYVAGVMNDEVRDGVGPELSNAG